MSLKPLRAALASILALSLGAACDQVIGSNFDQVEPFPECALARPPARPNATSSSGDISMVVALDRVDLGESVTGEPRRSLEYGFDFDGSCSSDLVPPPCLPPAWTKRTPEEGPGGVDNGLGQMIQITVDEFASTDVTTDAANAQRAAGAAAPVGVLRISGYNGVPVDTQLTVDFYIGAVPKDVGASKPTTDGTYEWPVDVNSVAGATDAEVGALVTRDSRFRDEQAYVASNVLVARFDSLVLSSLFGSAVEARRVVVTGRLQRGSSDQWELVDGTLAAVIRPEDLLAQVPRLAAKTRDIAIKLCTDETAFYPSLKAVICGAADIRSSSSAKATTCDAMTLGVRFAASPGRLGKGVVVEEDPSPCAAEVDPANDTCETEQPRVTPPK
jgi:hypothetical protein